MAVFITSCNVDDPMKETNFSHFTKLPPDDRRCTAKSKRSREQCKNWAMRDRFVCRFHGGKSLRGYESPRFVYGRYSKCFLARLPWMWHERQLKIERHITAEIEKQRAKDNNKHR